MAAASTLPLTKWGGYVLVHHILHHTLFFCQVLFSPFSLAYLFKKCYARRFAKNLTTWQVLCFNLFSTSLCGVIVFNKLYNVCVSVAGFVSLHIPHIKKHLKNSYYAKTNIYIIYIIVHCFF